MGTTKVTIQPAPAIGADELSPSILVWAAFAYASRMGSLEEVAEDAGLSPDALGHIFDGEGIVCGSLPGFFAWVASDPLWVEAWAALCDDMEAPAVALCPGMLAELRDDA